MNVAHADYRLGPRPHIFSSADGNLSLKVTPVYEGENRGKVKVTPFRLERDGSEMAWGEFLLDDAPQEILIPNSLPKYFVALDSERTVGSKNAIVIYDNGHVVRALELDDFLLDQEIQEHVKLTVSSQRWREGATFNFEIPVTEVAQGNGVFVEQHPGKTMLNIVFPWGKKVSIELATGKVINPLVPPVK